MTTQFGSFLTSGLATRYFNTFDLDPASGLLTVPRLLVHDEGYHVPASVEAQVFEEGMGPTLVEEIEEMREHLLAAYPGLHSSAGRFGPWGTHYINLDDQRFGLDSKTLSFRSSAGRLVEWTLENGAFILSVGIASPYRFGQDLHAKGNFVLADGGKSRNVGMEYNFSFDRMCMAGLLQFLDIADPGENFEWFSRSHLGRVLREKLNDGLQPNASLERFRSDHIGVFWRHVPGSKDDSSGAFYPDDSHSVLDVSFPSAPAGLPEGFLSLWDAAYRGIRELIRPPRVSQAA